MITNFKLFENMYSPLIDEIEMLMKEWNSSIYCKIKLEEKVLHGYIHGPFDNYYITHLDRDDVAISKKINNSFVYMRYVGYGIFDDETLEKIKTIIEDKVKKVKIKEFNI